MQVPKKVLVVLLRIKIQLTQKFSDDNGILIAYRKSNFRRRTPSLIVVGPCFDEDHL